MKNFKITLSVITIIIVAFLVWLNYSLSRTQLSNVENKLNQLELKADSLKLKPYEVQKLELKIDKLESELRKDYDLLLRGGIPASLLALLISFYGLYKMAYSFALEEAKKEIEKAYKSEEDLMKSEKEIVVIYKNGVETNDIRRFFHKLNFKNPQFLAFDKITELDTNKTDLVFLINPEGTFQFSDIDIDTIIININPFTVVFNFGANVGKDIREKKQFSSATMDSQIYGNLINALKYQKVLKP